MRQLYQHRGVQDLFSIHVAERGREQHQNRAHPLASGVHEVTGRPAGHVIGGGHRRTQTLLDLSQQCGDLRPELVVDVGDSRQRGRHCSPGSPGVGVAAHPPGRGMTTDAVDCGITARACADAPCPAPESTFPGPPLARTGGPCPAGGYNGCPHPSTHIRPSPRSAPHRTSPRHTGMLGGASPSNGCDSGHEKKGEQERRETPYTGPQRLSHSPHKDVRRRPTLPHPPECSTIGAVELSYRVRNGTGRFLDAMTTVTLRDNQPPTPHTPGRPGLLLQNHTVDANTSKQTSVD